MRKRDSPNCQPIRLAYDHPMDHVLEIVIVYEDFAAGVRAKRILDRLGAALKPAIEINTGLWKFELLDDPQLREHAASEASKADMIVVSARGDSDLPTAVKNWVERWLAQKGGGLAALVALLDHPPQTDDSSWPAYAYLLQVAGEGKMDFFCKTSDRVQPSEYTVEIAHRQPGSMSRQDPAWRSWCINN